MRTKDFSSAKLSTDNRIRSVLENKICVLGETPGYQYLQLWNGKKKVEIKGMRIYIFW